MTVRHDPVPVRSRVGLVEGKLGQDQDERGVCPDSGLLGDRVEPCQQALGVRGVLGAQLKELLLELGRFLARDHRPAPWERRAPTGESETCAISRSSGIGSSKATPTWVSAGRAGSATTRTTRPENSNPSSSL